MLRLHEEKPNRKKNKMNNKPTSIHATGNLPKIAWAKGSYLYDVDGKQYIDGSSGPAVYCIGHGNEEVNAAIADQLGRIAHVTAITSQLTRWKT